MRRLVQATVVASCAFLPAPPAHAQTSVGVDIGGHYALSVLEAPDKTASGLGAWVTWSLRRAFAIEADLSVFPSDDRGSISGGRLMQSAAGPRVGVRAGRFAAFGRARAGVAHFSRRFLMPERPCIAIFPTPESCLIESSNLLLDLGGGIEIYLTPRTLLRVDSGDALIRFGGDVRDPVWTHNLQLRVGAGVRF